MRAAMSALLLLVASCSCVARGADVTLPGELKTKPGRLLKIEAKSDAKSLVWIAPEGDADLISDTSGKWAIFSAPAPGRYRVVVVGVSGDQAAGPAVCWVIVEGAAPPKPPDPKPPPDPGPMPQPAPIAGDGLRVLIVYESGDLAHLPPARLAIIYDAGVRAYLNQKCPAGPDGKTKEWRIYDRDVDLSGESKTWQDAMRRPRTSVPWLVVSDGKSGWEGPLPENAEKTLEILKRFGG